MGIGVRVRVCMCVRERQNIYKPNIMSIHSICGTYYLGEKKKASYFAFTGYGKKLVCCYHWTCELFEERGL